MDTVPQSCPRVYIQRDYSDGMAVKFEKNIPRELEGKVSVNLYYWDVDIFEIFVLLMIIWEQLETADPSIDVDTSWWL